MKNAKAIYSPKRAITAGKFASIARHAGWDVEFLQPGGYVHRRYGNLVHQRGMTHSLNESVLLVGIATEEPDLKAKVDSLIDDGDSGAIREMLNGFEMPWIEVYSKVFKFEDECKLAPLWHEKITSAYDKKQLAAVRKARTRYLLYNPSRRKICNQFMNSLAAEFESGSDDLVVEHFRK